MANFGHSARRLGGRRKVVAVALIGWVTIVVMSSGPKANDEAFFQLPDLTGVIAVVILTLALCGLIILPFLFQAQDELPERPPKSRLALVLITAIIVLVLMTLDPDLVFEVPAEEQRLTPQGQADVADVVEEQPAQLGSLALLIAACMGTGAVLIWSRHRLGGAVDDIEGDDNDLDARMSIAIDDATEVLSHEGDPRAAVIGAYASLETAFSDLGLPRHNSETAAEHLRRVLGRFAGAADSAARLGDLYELARFSEHPITAQDQVAASQALQQSRDKLSPEPTAPAS